MINLLSAVLLSEGAVLGISIQAVGKAGAMVGITGLLVGILLGIAAKIFYVEVDEKEIAVRELLPGSNCGGCGYAGCDALAKAIAEGAAEPNTCPVANKETHARISEVMGVKVSEQAKKIAFVKCAGTCEKTVRKYDYYGLGDCKRVTVVPGRGDKGCQYGCMGYGTCERACKFDAIHVINGVAVVDKEKCVACNQCVLECPNQLIELVPYEQGHLVLCASKAKGKDVRTVCSVGCIGCKICEKQCEFDAVHVENNLAYIDSTKCTNCGKCAEKCPQKIISHDFVE